MPIRCEYCFKHGETISQSESSMRNIEPMQWEGSKKRSREAFVSRNTDIEYFIEDQWPYMYVLS